MNAQPCGHRETDRPQPAPSAAADPPAADRGAIYVSLIVLVAFAVRLVYLYQIEGIPFFYGLISDAERYDAWARSIASGDWWGQTTFYQAPLYPYFLAAVKAALADSPFVTRLAQIVLGSLSCGLLALAGRAFFSPRAGLWAGAVLALYPPAIFFDGLIQKTSLAQFLFCLLLALLGWQQLRVRAWRSLAIGAVLGLFCLTRENGLALVPVVLVWAWLYRPAERAPGARLRFWRTALVLAGLILVLLPVGLRNRFVGGEFVLTTAQMGPNFYIGNNPDATGRYRPLVKGHETPEFEQDDARRLAEQDVGHPLTPREVSRYWSGLSWAYIRSQPLDWLKLLGNKWLLVWNAYEIPDSESYYVYRDWSWLLVLLGSLMHYGVLVPLAAAGVVLFWGQRRRLGVLYALVLVTAAAVTLFYIFARYRYPIVPVAVLFAGAALPEAVALFRASRWRPLTAAACALVPTAVLVNLTLNPEGELNATAWGNVGSALARQESMERAVACFERAVEGAPHSAEMHYNLGLAYSFQGRFAQAVEQLRTALRISPNLVEADYQLAVALERLGRLEEALHHYRRALQLNPDDAEAKAALQRLSP